MMISAEPIPEDLSWVRLREADEAECQVAGMTGAEAIKESARTGMLGEHHLIRIDNEPVAFWGYSVRSLIDTTAYGWLLTLPALDAYSRVFARTSKRIIKHILSRYPRLVIIVHYKHYAAVRWLEWLGFEETGFEGDFTLMAIRRK